MFKNLKFGLKIGLGFAVILLITIILNLNGIINMNSSSNLASILNSEYIPEVEIATKLRGAANRIMYQMRGYGYTEEDRFLEAAQKEGDLLDKAIAEGRELSKTAIHLKKLEEELQKAEEAKNNYVALVEETIKVNNNMQRLRLEMICISFIDIGFVSGSISTAVTSSASKDSIAENLFCNSSISAWLPELLSKSSCQDLRVSNCL